MDGLRGRGEYANVANSGAIHPERGRTAANAIRKGHYEKRGTRDDGAVILVTRTDPAMVVVGKVNSEAGRKPDLFLLHLAEMNSKHRCSQT
jgi:hypothetical protein